MKYTTLQKVKDANPSTTLTDPQIEELIEFVSGYMDSYVGYTLARDFSDGTKTILVDGSGTEYLMLYSPVNGDITLEELSITDIPTPVLYSVSYPLNEPYIAYIGLKQGKFKSGMANYRISGARIGRYTVDFTTPANHTLPEELKAVATVLTSSIVADSGVQESASSTGMITSEDTGSYSVSYAQPTPELMQAIMSAKPNATTVLKSYKKVNIV